MNPTKSNKHTRTKNTVYSTPPDTVWLNVGGGHVSCGAASISVPNALSQMREKDTDFLMMAAYPTRPGILSSSSGLVESGAFEIVHQEGEVTKDDGFALLKSTNQTPKPTPVWMGAVSVLRLRACMRTAEGSAYAQEIRSKFPQGIELVTGTDPELVGGVPPGKSDAEARRAIEDIYQGRDSATGVTRSGGSG